MNLSVAILAGGLGTRLAPLTETVPKSLIDVAGKPFAIHQIALLRRNQIADVVLCVGHLGELIRQVLGDGSRLGVRIDYVFDGTRSLGTAGALKKALPMLGDRFFVLYGDSYLDMDYQAARTAFGQSGKLGLMTVFQNAGQWDRSNVLFADGQILRYDKRNPTPEMQHIDYGLGLLRNEALSNLPEDQFFDLADLYQDLTARGQLAGFEVTQRFYEIGSPEGLEETRRYLSGHREEAEASYTQRYLAEASQIISQIDTNAVDRMVKMLLALRRSEGRLFFLGVGGGAGHASHAVNDFRKIAGIEAYTPTDNVSELTARVNDDGWETVFVNWLRTSRLNKKDMVFVFSVGGGDLAHSISPNLVRALEYAREVGATICGVVGRNGGYTAQVADACVVIPTANPETITPHTEAFQAVVWHLLVSHPDLRVAPMKWESVR